MIIGRMEGKCITQAIWPADQRAACLKRRIQPFVRIHGHRIRLAQSSESGRGIGQYGGQTAIGSINMEPKIELSAYFRQSG